MGPLQSLVSSAGRARHLPGLVHRLPAVREPLAFTLNEVRPQPSVGCYRLRKSGLACFLRHHENDMGALEEVFIDECYRPPPEVDRWLRSRESTRMLDLGTHVGLFALYMLGRYPGASVTGVEPDPRSAALARQACSENGLGGRWEVIEASAGTSNGTVRFVRGMGVSSHIPDATAPGSMDVLSLDTFGLLPDADLLKIDIEGGEWAILLDERARELPPVVVIEYHRRLCPEPDPERAARRLLEAAGLTVGPTLDQSEDMGLLWAIEKGVVG